MTCVGNEKATRSSWSSPSSSLLSSPSTTGTLTTSSRLCAKKDVNLEAPALVAAAGWTEGEAVNRPSAAAEEASGIIAAAVSGDEADDEDDNNDFADDESAGELGAIPDTVV